MAVNGWIKPYEFLEKEVISDARKNIGTKNYTALDIGSGFGTEARKLAPEIRGRFFTLEPTLPVQVPRMEAVRTYPKGIKRLLATAIRLPAYGLNAATLMLFSKNHISQRMERAKFRPESINLAYAAFSLEYMNQSVALQRINHILKPDGKLVLLLHHPESVVTNEVRDETEKRVALFERLAEELLAGNEKPILDEVEKRGRESKDREVLKYLAKLKKMPAHTRFEHYLNLIGSMHEGLKAQFAQNNRQFRSKEEIVGFLRQHGFTVDKIEVIYGKHNSSPIETPLSFGVVARKVG